MKDHKKRKVGLPSKPRAHKPGKWVQTEQSSHEAWARLTLAHTKAAALMHLLVSRMDRSTNAVVASHKTLAAMMNSSERSIKNWISTLANDNWLQVVSLGPGSTNAYVINSVVAWSVSRDNLQYAVFTAQVIAARSDQVPEIKTDLRRIPVLFPGEDQMPAGPGEAPPSQPYLPGTEPDLPCILDDSELS